MRHYTKFHSKPLNHCEVIGDLTVSKMAAVHHLDLKN